MLLVLSLLTCAVGVVAGVFSGPLWLDETLSVEIARLPRDGLYAALRQDGAPPLYYLLLKGWMALLGTGTVTVRLLTVLVVPVALLLAWRLGHRLGGVAGGRAVVIVLAALPWTMRYGSEARMYLLVVALVLAAALALEAVHRTRSWRAVPALAALTGLLLLTHYWALFLVAATGLVHLPGLLRRSPGAVRVVVGLVGGGLLFLPWLPTLLFQAAHTGAPWADPLVLVELLRTPRYWGGGSVHWRTVLGLTVVALVVWGVLRRPAARMPAGIALVTLLLAFTTVYVLGGAYTGRYTAVAVPLVCVAAGLGAAGLPQQRRAQLVALGLLVAVGAASGIPAAGRERTSAQDVVDAFRAAGGSPDDVLAYCPDQLGPAVQRLLGGGPEQVVYPTFGDPRRIDWVDYEARQAAAAPRRFAAQLSARAGDRTLFVLASNGYRTFEGQCQQLVSSLHSLRGRPRVLLGEIGEAGQILYRFPPPRSS